LVEDVTKPFITVGCKQKTIDAKMKCHSIDPSVYERADGKNEKIENLEADVGWSEEPAKKKDGYRTPDKEICEVIQNYEGLSTNNLPLTEAGPMMLVRTPEMSPEKFETEADVVLESTLLGPDICLTGQKPKSLGNSKGNKSQGSTPNCSMENSPAKARQNAGSEREIPGKTPTPLPTQNPGTGNFQIPEPEDSKFNIQDDEFLPTDILDENLSNRFRIRL
jgi:hypothetical protein